MKPDEISSYEAKEELQSAIAGILKLHSLSVHDMTDSPEADEIRDQLDGIWEKLSEDEQLLVRGLSSDLNWIEGGFAPRSDPSMPAEQDLRALAAAVEAQQWVKVLALSRKCARAIPPSGLAYFRGNAWMGLGFPAVACLFREYAHKLEPSNEGLAYLYLSVLEVAHPESLRKLATTVLGSPDHHLVAEVIKAVSVTLDETTRGQSTDQTRVFESSLAILERVLVRLRILLPDLAPVELHSVACGLAGFCCEGLGELDRAEKFYAEALRRASENEGLLVARGMLNYARKRANAVADFKAAAKTRTGRQRVWPFLFLAHHSLVEGRFEDCLRYATRGATLTQTPSIQSDLLEWVAISLCELGGAPPEVIRGMFAEAERLAPDNPRISTNRKSFEESLKDQLAPILQREDVVVLLQKVAAAYNPISTWTPQELRPAA